MVVGALQALVSEYYALDLALDVSDFLTTDAAVAAALDDGGRPNSEKLLINEQDGEAELCLYLDADLVERLERDDPLARLHPDNLADFLTAFEGVSHFVYYAWNAAFDKSVTLLEMELQAEVDKFIATTLLLGRQGVPLPRDLHRWLFDMPKLDPRLDTEERDRYRHANRYAARYCRSLSVALTDPAPSDEVQSELRRFYRLPQPRKIEHIDALP